MADNKKFDTNSNALIRIVLGIIIGAVIASVIALFISLIASLFGGVTAGLIAKQNKKFGFILGGISALLSIPIIYLVNRSAASLLLFSLAPLIVFVLGAVGGILGSHFAKK